MKRILPIALLVLGTLLAVVAGWGTNTIAASYLALGEGESLEKVRAKPRPDAPSGEEPGATVADTAPAASRPRGLSKQRYLDDIMKRNIFDHNNVGKVDDGGPKCEGPDCEHGAKSDLPVVLIATKVTDPDMYSSAYIMDENSKESKVYHIDSQLLDAKIERIYTRRVVVVRGDGTREYIAMDGDEKIDSGKPRSAAASGDGDGPTKVSDDEYDIPREIIDNAIGNIDSLAKMARARPHKDDSGNVDGYRLSGIRRGKLPYKLGIKNGDIVHSVNGIPLTSTQEALNAWQSLQNEANFTFEITRRGQKKTMKYNVR